MSLDIVSVRRQMKLVSFSLRQGKPVPAVQAVVVALRVMLTTPLMKSERDEFADLVREALHYINNDAGIRKMYPLELKYQAGEEKLLLGDMQDLLGVIGEEAMSEVEELARAMAARKEAALAKGREHLGNKDYSKARSVFSAISDEFPDDGDLKGSIGEKFLAEELYEDAAAYFADAAAIGPGALHLYNYLAIALRKLQRFAAAEDCYMKALLLAPKDPNLLFNIGRMYLDWQKWDKAAEFGDRAFEINPQFEEARKLAVFARKRI